MIVKVHIGRANSIMSGKLAHALIQILMANLATGAALHRFGLPLFFKKVLGKDYVFIDLPSKQSTKESNRTFKVVTIDIDSNTTATPPTRQIEMAMASSKGVHILLTSIPTQLLTVVW